MNIYIDIETIPSQDESVKKSFLDNVKAPGNFKKQESIDDWLVENREKVADEDWRKTSFDGGLGQVCCVSVAINDEPVVTFFSENWKHSEPEIISDLFHYLESNYDPSRQIPPVFIGHNIAGFDLRFLFQRAVVLGIKPPRFIPFGAKSWDKQVFDTMTQWAGHGNRVSLDKLCQVLGLAAKGAETGEGIDGSKVWDFVRDGKISTVAKYCEGDVERVRAIHKRMTFQTA